MKETPKKKIRVIKTLKNYYIYKPPKNFTGKVKFMDWKNFGKEVKVFRFKDGILIPEQTSRKKVPAKKILKKNRDEKPRFSVWEVQFVIQEKNEFGQNIVSTVNITSFSKQLETKVRAMFDSLLEEDKQFSISVSKDGKQQFVAKKHGNVVLIDKTTTLFVTWLREISK